MLKSPIKIFTLLLKVIFDLLPKERYISPSNKVLFVYFFDFTLILSNKAVFGYIVRFKVILLLLSF